MVLYIDFICPVCKNFEAQYNETLTKLRNEGKITVEYRPLGFLDSRSSTNYSSRAANAAACVVNESPEKYAAFVDALFAKQPAEGGAGLSDAELKKMATDAGAKSIDKCVDDKTYRPYVKYTTAGGRGHRRHRYADRLRRGQAVGQGRQRPDPVRPVPAGSGGRQEVTHRFVADSPAPDSSGAGLFVLPVGFFTGRRPWATLI